MPDYSGQSYGTVADACGVVFPAEVLEVSVSVELLFLCDRLPSVSEQRQEDAHVHTTQGLKTRHPLMPQPWMFWELGKHDIQLFAAAKPS